MNNSSDSQIRAATLNIAASSPDATTTSYPCVFEGLEGQRLTLDCGGRPAISDAISVEYNDVMFLGEVVSATPGLDHTWRVEAKVMQTLTGLQSLLKLRAQLLGEEVSEPVGIGVARVRA